MLNVAQRIAELNSQKLETNSNKSSRSAMSKSSKHSNVSQVSDAAKRKAILQAKLKYIDMESKCKAQLEKIQTMKEMEMVEAEIDVLREHHFEPPETNLKVHLPFVKDGSQGYVKEYIEGLRHPPCPTEVDVIVSDSKVTTSESLVTSQSSADVHLTTTTTSNATDAMHAFCKSQSLASVLSPMVPEFVPSGRTQVCTQNT